MPAGTDATPLPASRVARVHVDEAVWAEFRRAIGERSVAEVLGRYVELEVARWHRDRATRGELTDRELVEAIEQARALTEALDRVTGRLEARLPRQT